MIFFYIVSNTDFLCNVTIKNILAVWTYGWNGLQKDRRWGFIGIDWSALLDHQSKFLVCICPTITKGVVRTRTTSDPKSEKVKLRLNVEMKSHIDKYSREKGISVSEYIRELITKDMINKR